MKKSEEILANLIELLTTYLTELNGARVDAPKDQFAYGEKTAYVECLEYLAEWEGAVAYGLKSADDVERRYPL